MVKSWLVRLRLARDDGGSLSEDRIRELTDLLTSNGVLPVLENQESGIVLVHMTIDATSDRAARAATESMLGDRARHMAGTACLRSRHLRRGEAGGDPTSSRRSPWEQASCGSAIS
jgi:hypothetical protein